MAGSSIHAQTRQALTNCEAILRAGGASLEDAVVVGVLLSDPGDFAGVNQEYAQWFFTDAPARYAAELGAHVPGCSSPSVYRNHRLLTRRRAQTSSSAA